MRTRDSGRATRGLGLLCWAVLLGVSCDVAPEGAAADGGRIDGGRADAAARDAVVADAGGRDSGAADTTPADTGSTDASVPDAAGRDATPPDGGTDAAGRDATPPDGGTDAAGRDAESGPPCGGEVGCLCGGAEDCRGGACALSEDGQRRCAPPCAGGCPEGSRCGRVDGVPACVAVALTDCQPCDDDDFCRSGGDDSARCVRGPDGAFCATGCSADRAGEDRACPGDTACEEVEQPGGEVLSLCLPLGDCVCNAAGVGAGASTRCTPDGAPGCAGRRTCVADPETGAPILGPCEAMVGPERCDGVDDDCDGTVDEGCDADGDGYCRADAVVLPGAACRPGDCDDGNPAIHPGAEEVPADGVDQDCDGVEPCHPDADQDGARAAGLVATDRVDCPRAAGFARAAAPLDCDDTDPAVRPGGLEVPGDGIDGDCDGRELCFADVDGDGARTTATVLTPALACDLAGLAAADAPLDCDDEDPTRHPGAGEQSDDGLDADCDGIELFAGQPLAMPDALGAPPAEVAVAGTFTAGDLGAIEVTGAVARAAAGAPVTWCLTGSTDATIGPLTLLGARVTICRDAAGEVTAWITGPAELAGRPVTVDGPFELAAPHDLHLHATGEVDLGGARWALSDDRLRSYFARADGAIDWQLVGSTQVWSAGGAFALAPATATVDAEGVTVTGRAELPLPVGWPAGEVELSGALQPGGGATLVGELAAPYDLGDALRLDPARLRVEAGDPPSIRFEGEAEVSLPGVAPRVMTFAAELDPVVRPALRATLDAVAVCGGLMLSDVEVRAAMGVDGTPRLALAGDTTIAVGGAPRPVRLAGPLLPGGAGFTLEGATDRIDALGGAIELREATLRAVCEGGDSGDAALQILARGAADLTFPDGSVRRVVWEGPLVDGEVPVLRSVLDPQDTMSVFGGDVTLDGLQIEARLVNGRVHYTLSGLDRIELEGAGVDVEVRYTADYTPGVDLVEMSGRGTGEGDTVTLFGLTLTDFRARIWIEDGQLKREISGIYTLELPDGRTLRARLVGRYGGREDILLRGLLDSDPPGLFEFTDELRLTEAGIEVLISGGRRQASLFGVYQLDLGSRVVEVPLRAQIEHIGRGEDDEGYGITLTGALTGPGGSSLFELIPGVFDLDRVTVEVIARKNQHPLTGRKVAVRLTGNATVSFDGIDHPVQVSGELAYQTVQGVNSLVLRLDGRIPGAIEPLRAVIGDGRFAFVDPFVTFDLTLSQPAGVRLVVASDFELCLTATCVAGQGIQGSAAGLFSYGRGQPTQGWVRGALRGIEVPGIGSLGDVAIIANTATLVDFDPLGDNAELVSDTRFWQPRDFLGDNRFNRLPVVQPGVTLVYQADSPLPFTDREGDLQFSLGVGLDGLSASAKLPLDVPLITPEVGLPGIDGFTMRDVRLTVSVGFVDNPSLFVAFDGRAELLPAGQVLPLLGTFRVRGGVDTVGASIDLLATVEGRWIEPFGLPDFALQNPSFGIGLNVTPGPAVVPGSAGVNGDFFILREGEWPPEDLDLHAQLPPNVLKIGGTVYYDKQRTRSSLCLPLSVWCPTIPKVVLRFEVQNINLVEVMNYLRIATTYLRNLGQDIADAVNGTTFPDEFEPHLAEDHGDTRIDRMKLTFATHSGTILGQRWEGGLRAELDMEVAGADVTFEGYANLDGITLDGFAEATILPPLQLVGDPFRQAALLGGGHIEVPHDARFTLSAGTLEGWVKGPWGPDALSGILLSKTDDTNGYALGVGEPNEDGLARVTFEVRQGGAVRRTRSRRGVIYDDGRRHHVAVVFEGADAAIFVDGAEVDREVEGAEIAGPGPNAAPLRMGQGLPEMDDVRIWNEARARADIKGESVQLPLDFHRDPRLVARYEFDYDSPGSPAYNTRFYDGTKLHGAYLGGAAARLLPEDQDYHFTFHLGLSDIYLGLQAGARLVLPPPIGIDQRFAARLKVSPIDLAANGRFHMTSLPLLPALGSDDGQLTFEGFYVLDGGGPNLQRHDFDDGPFGAFDLADFSLAASVALVHRRVDGSERDLGALSFSYFCPPEQVCPDGQGRVFRAAGNVDFAIPLSRDARLDPPDANTLHIQGAASVGPGEFSVGGAEGQSGRITVLGHRLSEGCFFMTSNTALTVCDDCGNGRVEGAEQCDDGNRDDGDGCSANCKQEPVDLSPGIKRMGFRGVLDLPPVVFATLQSDLVIGGPITMSGHGVLRAGDFALSETSFRVDGTGVHARTALRIGQTTAELEGEVNADGTFDIAWQGELAIAGFTLSDSNVRAWWDGVTGGVTLDGMLDVGVARARVRGRFDAQGRFELAYDGDLNIGDWAVGDAHLVLTDQGATLEGHLRIGEATSFVRGRIEADGRFSLSGGYALPIGGFAFGGATVTLAGGGGQPVVLSFNGETRIVAAVVRFTGTIGTDGSYDLTGLVSLRAPDAPGGVVVHGDGRLNAQGLLVDGYVDVSGHRINSGAIRVTPQFAEVRTRLDLPVVFDRDLGGIDLALRVDFATGAVCGDGSVLVDTDVGDYGCDVSVCLDGGLRVTNLNCHGRCWSDGPCGDGKFCDALGNCWPKRPLGEQCAGVLAGDHECLSGFCDPWVAFPAAICAERLEEGVGCLQPGQCLSEACGLRPGLIEHRCYRPGTRVVGQECYDALHCSIGECWGTALWPSQCLCTTNAQCEASGHAGKVCKLGDWGITPESGFCVPPRQEGQGCLATSECAGGLTCDGGICIRPASRGNWQACSRSAECVQGECWGGVCRCRSHAECHAELGAGTYCDQGAWALGNEEGRCHARVDNNARRYCEDDGWCNPGGWCEDSYSLFIGNVCVIGSNWPHDTPCDVNAQCGTQNGQQLFCVYWPFGNQFGGAGFYCGF